MYIITIIILFIILILFFINNLLNKNINENFDNKLSNNIIFLEKDFLINFLINDEDNYYKNFSKYDLIARKINNIDEYYEKIKESVININENQKNKIIECINNIDEKLRKIKIDGFDGEKSCKIIWKIGVISGNKYENGLPHTRGNIIILPVNKINNYSLKKLSITLCHEKIHIYQKIYKDDVNKYLKKNNIKILKKKKENDMIRANPDLDNNIYYDNNLTYSAKYNSLSPESIEDITYNYDGTQSSEHPFERMAIEIENI